MTAVQLLRVQPGLHRRDQEGPLRGIPLSLPDAIRAPIEAGVRGQGGGPKEPAHGL